jgi:hypothetical protein
MKPHRLIIVTTVTTKRSKGGGSMEVTYDPDNMWNVGHHVLPEMCERHRRARALLAPVDDSGAAVFRSDLYRRTKDLWIEAVSDFRTRLGETDDRIRGLGDAVELVVLNHIRAEEIAVETLDRTAYRVEVLEELA